MNGLLDVIIFNIYRPYIGIWNLIRRETMTVTLNGMQNVAWHSVIANVSTRRRFEITYGLTNLT
jgi:hypothetical protein